jgi:hypothetical protein
MGAVAQPNTSGSGLGLEVPGDKENKGKPFNPRMSKYGQGSFR